MTLVSSYASHLLTGSHYLCGDNFKREVSRRDGWIYRKIEFIWKSGTYRGEHQQSALYRVPLRDRQFLVYGHSSKEVKPWQIRGLHLAGFSHIWGTNARDSRHVTAIPLGLTNDSGESPAHELMGPVVPILEAIQQERSAEFNTSLYANFNVDNSSQRRHLARLLRDLSINFVAPTYTPEGRLKALVESRRNNFVLCPRGVGVETHRMWETLMLGGIPVVETHPFLEPFVKVLPILAVDSWDRLLDTPWLEERFYEIESRDYDPQVLDVRYWLQDRSRMVPPLVHVSN